MNCRNENLLWQVQMEIRWCLRQAVVKAETNIELYVILSALALYATHAAQLYIYVLLTVYTNTLHLCKSRWTSCNLRSTGGKRTRATFQAAWGTCSSR